MSKHACAPIEEAYLLVEDDVSPQSTFRVLMEAEVEYEGKVIVIRSLPQAIHGRS